MMSAEADLLAVLTVAVGIATVVAEDTPTLTVTSVLEGLSQVKSSQLQFAAVTWTVRAV